MNLKEIFEKYSQNLHIKGPNGFRSPDNAVDAITLESFEAAIQDYEKSKWISDRFPNHGQTVIFQNKHNEVLEGVYNSQNQNCIASCNGMWCMVIAWQPFPKSYKPPKP